jgi:hypothetical protein
MSKWIIKDWIGNRLWPTHEFDSFEEGWMFIYAENPEPEENSEGWIDGWHDDYYVIRKPKEAQ